MNTWTAGLSSVGGKPWADDACLAGLVSRYWANEVPLPSAEMSRVCRKRQPLIEATGHKVEPSFPVIS
jgi:hypothetical protein